MPTPALSRRVLTLPALLARPALHTIPPRQRIPSFKYRDIYTIGTAKSAVNHDRLKIDHYFRKQSQGTKNAIHTSKEREASTKENANISDSEKDNPTSIALPLLALALHNPKGLLLVPSQVQPASLKLTKYEDFLNRKRPGKKENESPLKLQKLVHESQEVSSFSKIPILGYSLNGDHGSDPINVDVEENSSVPTITQPSTLSTRASSVAVEEIRDEDKKRNGQHIVNPGPDGPILESIDNNVLLGDYDPSWEEEVDENLYSKFSRQVDDAVNEELSNGKTEHLYIYVSDSDDDVVLVPTTLHPGEQKAGNLSDSDQETKAQESAKKRSSHLLAKEIQGVRKAERRSASQAVQDEYDEDQSWYEANRDWYEDAIMCEEQKREVWAELHKDLFVEEEDREDFDVKDMTNRETSAERRKRIRETRYRIRRSIWRPTVSTLQGWKPVRLHFPEFDPKEFAANVQQYTRHQVVDDMRSWYKHHGQTEANDVREIFRGLPGDLDLCKAILQLQNLETTPSMFMRSVARASKYLNISKNSNVLYIKMIRCSVQKGLEIARRFLKERSSRQYARTIENHLNAIIAKLERLDPEKVVWISYLGTSINFASRAAGDVLEMQGKIEGVPVTRMVTYFLTEAAGVKDVNNTAYVTWNQGIPSYHGSSNAPQPLNTSNTQQFDDSIVSCIRIPFINLKDQYAVHPSSMESALIGLLAPCCLNTALGNNKTFQINGFKYGDFIRGKASPITLAKTENTTRTGIVTPKSKRYRHSILAWLKIAKGWLRDYLLRYLWKPFSFLNVVDRFSAFHKDPTNPPSSMEEMISYSRSLREVRGAHVIDSTVVATLNPQEAQNEEKEEPEEALPPYKEYRKAFYPTSPRATLAGLEDPKSGREGEPKQYRLTCLIRCAFEEAADKKMWGHEIVAAIKRRFPWYAEKENELTERQVRDSLWHYKCYEVVEKKMITQGPSAPSSGWLLVNPDVSAYEMAKDAKMKRVKGVDKNKARAKRK